jgi:hypothetical protein
MVDLVESFIATAFSLSGVHVPVDGVEVVVVAPVSVDVVPPFAFADPEFPFGVVDDASFAVAPFEGDVLAVAPEVFAFVVFTEAPVDAFVVVVLGP